MRNLCILMLCVLSTTIFSSCKKQTSVTAFAISGGQMPQMLAFPGAEGFGAFAKGGRGGRVIQVTTLQDYHPGNEKAIPGSLRAACADKGPRIIVFRVSGNIDLKAPLLITEPYCTIAGQTAPGDGICIRCDELDISTHDVVVRYLRARCGPGRKKGDEPHSIALNNCNDVILDHCSITWGVDECLAITAHPTGYLYDDDGNEKIEGWIGPRGVTENVTVQWCIVAEGLKLSTHIKGAHSMGLMVAYCPTRITLHHNLIAHNNDRNPYLPAEGFEPYLIDVRNNLVYNWGAAGAVAYRKVNKRGRINFIGNLYIPGPNSKEIHCLTMGVPSEVFAYDNIGPIRSSNDMPQANAVTGIAKLVEKPFEVQEVTTHPVSEILSLVLKNVGATLPKRDSADQRLVTEVEQNKGMIIDDPQQVGGWPVLQAAEPYPDSNNDGMPDEWQKQYGLDLNDTTVGYRDPDGDGYTNIEEYLNGTDPNAR